MSSINETVWAWLGEWVSAVTVAGPGYGLGRLDRRAHTVRTANGKIHSSYCTQYRNPALEDADKPTWRVWERGETVWARLKGRGWTRARMYSAAWPPGPSASVYTGRVRGNESYLVDRLAGLRSRDPAKAGQDRPS